MALWPLFLLLAVGSQKKEEEPEAEPEPTAKAPLRAPIPLPGEVTEFPTEEWDGPEVNVGGWRVKIQAVPNWGWRAVFLEKKGGVFGSAAQSSSAMAMQAAVDYAKVHDAPKYKEGVGWP